MSRLKSDKRMKKTMKNRTEKKIKKEDATQEEDGKTTKGSILETRGSIS